MLLERAESGAENSGNNWKSAFENTQQAQRTNTIFSKSSRNREEILKRFLSHIKNDHSIKDISVMPGSLTIHTQQPLTPHPHIQICLYTNQWRAIYNYTSPKIFYPFRLISINNKWIVRWGWWCCVRWVEIILLNWFFKLWGCSGGVCLCLEVPLIIIQGS